MSMLNKKNFTTTTTRDILRQLKKVNGSPPNWTACCPAHGDKSPSLSVRETNNGTVLLHCHAGCKTEDVVQALGLKMSDLFPEAKYKGNAPSEVYSYENADGQEIFQVLRYPNKQFPIRQPDGTGGWSWSGKGLQRVPYRLPRILSAIDRGDRIFITEGEKDVHTLERLGFIATCCPGGANAWRREYGQYFKGAHILLCGDNDEAGLKHQVDITRSCFDASSVRRISIPQAFNDVSEWYEQDGGIETFRTMIAQAREFDAEAAELSQEITSVSTFSGAGDTIHDSQPYSSREMMKISVMFGYEDPPPMRWIVDGIIPYNYVTILGGDGGTGKSFLALELMHAVATGSPFLGQSVEETNVLFVDFELQEEDQRRRWNRLLKGKGINQHAESIKDRVYFIKPQVPLSVGKLTEELVRAVDDYDAGLVIIDSLTIGLGGDATNQEVITKVMQSLDRLSTVVALDHLTHNQRRSNLADASVYGSVMKRNGARSMLILGKAEGGGIVLRQNKTNFGKQRDIICYEMVFSQDETGPVTFETRSLTDTAMSGATQSLSSSEITLLAIQDICKDGATASREDIAAWREARGHGISPVSVGNQLTPLRASNRIVRVGINSWKPASSNSSQSPSLRAVNSENADSTGIPLFDVGSRVITPDGPGSIADSTLSDQGRFAVRLDGNAQYETQYYGPEQLQWISDEGSPK